MEAEDKGERCDVLEKTKLDISKGKGSVGKEKAGGGQGRAGRRRRRYHTKRPEN